MSNKVFDDKIGDSWQKSITLRFSLFVRFGFNAFNKCIYSLGLSSVCDRIAIEW